MYYFTLGADPINQVPQAHPCLLGGSCYWLYINYCSLLQCCHIKVLNVPQNLTPHTMTGPLFSITRDRISHWMIAGM
jgi:hypothetical protein